VICVAQKRSFIGYLAFFQPHTIPIKCNCKILQKRRFHPESLYSSSLIIFRIEQKSDENFEEVLQIFEDMERTPFTAAVPGRAQQLDESLSAFHQS
jgi:hypothetical protein